jgi:sulfur carrier protein ThiS
VIPGEPLGSPGIFYMRISIKLAGPLRKEVQGHENGELDLELPEGTMLSKAVDALGIKGRVRLLLLNGRPQLEDRELVEGDRLFLMPPELAYNMYVATNFLSPMARDEIRKKQKEEN